MNHTYNSNIRMNTKTRILDIAEKLFAQDGIEATSLRAITAGAGVNLAAVNYHFQSKEALLRAVIARRIDPINQRRLEMLDACEAAAGEGALPLRRVVQAFLDPVIEANASAESEFAPLIGRLYSEPGGFMVQLFKDHMQTVARRFQAAFQRALPHLPHREVLWRISFMAGAMSHTMAAGSLIRAMSDGLCDPSDAAGTSRRLEDFVTAGFESPLAEVAHEH
jgi:AcrR family transcriptional regulator